MACECAPVYETVQLQLSDCKRKTYWYYKNKSNEDLLRYEIDEREKLFLYINKAKQIADRVKRYKYYIVEFTGGRRAFITAVNRDDALTLANALKIGSHVPGKLRQSMRQQWIMLLI